MSLCLLPADTCPSPFFLSNVWGVATLEVGGGGGVEGVARGNFRRYVRFDAIMFIFHSSLKV